MSFDSVVAVVVVITVFITLMTRRAAPTDLVFLGGLVLVTLFGVISPSEALTGFANPAVIMIAALFVVAAGLRATGALDMIGHHLLGTARSERSALLRLAVPTVTLSALMNNTPLVAIMVPTVMDWCRRVGVSPSRVLMPLSYLAILGGTCTLIGTSTNLVVHGLMLEHFKVSDVKSFEFGMGFFEIGLVGLPCGVVGIIYLLTFGIKSLPNRLDLIENLGAKRREYLLEMLVQPGCRLAGQTVEKAGLRNLAGLFLIEIDRGGEIITPVTPRDIIQAGDRLVFTGVVSTIVDLEKIPGLVPAADSSYVMDPSARARRHLTEAVLSVSSPLIGSTVKEAKFRQLYNAAVIAVHRNGVRVTNKIGNIRLEAGDTLLLQTNTEFIDSFRHSSDFYLVSGVQDASPRRHDRIWIALTLLGILVVMLSAASWFSRVSSLEVPENALPMIALAIAGLMVAMRCLPVATARGAIDLQVLLTIGAAIGLGRALNNSGAAGGIATSLTNAVGAENGILLLIVVYILTLLFTEMITNVAVAALMVPIAIAVATPGGHDPTPFVMAIALAASTSFITPIGYQTNLMVMGPGGYRPIDYLKTGLPLSILVAITALLLIPIVWPL